MADIQASNQPAAGRPGIQGARSGGRTGLQDSQISQIVVISKDTGEQRVVLETDQPDLRAKERDGEWRR